jgi:plasmid stabilization system protein ParE
MNSDQGFHLHPGAVQDITEIWEYIAADNVDAARSVREAILDVIRGLIPFPRQGHVRIDLASSRLLFKPVGEFLIAYAPDKEPLLVIPVLHGRRSPRVIAAILRERK